jgi:hypothetical protein
MPSLNTGNAILSNPIKVDSSYNVGIGGAASGSFKLQVTGTSNLTGALTGTSGVFSSSLTATAFIPTSSSIPTNGLYLPAANTLGFSTNSSLDMVITAAGNVGIGTASPSDFIDAGLGLAIINTSGRTGLSLGSTQGTADEVLGRLSFTNTNSTNIGSKRLAYISGIRGTSDNSAYLEFGTADNALGTQRMIISQAGNVGIGITPNTWDGTNVKALQVYNTSLSGSLTWGASLGWNNYYNGGWKYIFTGTAGKYDIGGDEHIWSNAPSGTAGNAISFVERMKINSAGNIEIKTTRTSGANVNTITIADNVTGVQTPNFGVRILATSNNGSARSALAFEQDGGTNNDTSIAFYTQFSAASLDRRMTINRSGNILVGSSTADYGFNFAVGINGGHSFLGNTMQISAGDYGGTERQGAFGVAEWANVSSTTINLATIFPRINFTSRTLSVLVQIGNASTTTTMCSCLVLFGRTVNSTWSSTIIANININGLALSSVSGSGTTITLNFGTATFGSAMITILNRA